MEYADCKPAALRRISPAARAPPDITRNIPGHGIVPQRMHGHALVDLGQRSGFMDGAVELARRQVLDRVQARKQPPPIEHLALGAGYTPPNPQALQQHGREHGVAVLAALALFHAQGHAFAVNVTDPECEKLNCVIWQA